MKAALTLIILSTLILTEPILSMAQEPPSLTVDQVYNLLRGGASPETVLRLINETRPDFTLSLPQLDSLRKAGVPEAILDAMLRSRSAGRERARGNPPPLPEPDNGQGPPPPKDIKPGSTGQPSGAVVKSGNTATGDSGPSIPAHSIRRLRQAQAIAINTTRIPYQAPSPACSSGFHQVGLDYSNGKGSSSRLNRSGNYCFYLFDFNPLFDYAINPEVTSPTGNPFDLLNDAIQILKNLATGAAAGAAAKDDTNAANKSTGKPPTPSPATACSDSFSGTLAIVSVKATKLRAALTAMIPVDSSGKVIYVDGNTTYAKWNAAQLAFDELEAAVKTLQDALPTPTGNDACNVELLAQADSLAEAESIILDDYPSFQRKYQDLANKLNRPHYPSVATSLDATDTVSVKVLTTYAGAAVETKTFNFEPSFGILSSSAGFIISSLPARAYSSVTAPNPADPTMTQNVLSIENGRGVRPALTVLLTGNIPQLNRRNFGLGFSAGPVFDISSGKADTSRFGFFAGPSARITPWIFLTPGFHFGEFADFPQGFTHAGQVIPANTGAPVPVKRFTGRFAFAVTFKLKDLGSLVGSSGAKP